MNVVLLAIEAVLFIIAVYGCYKVIWYSVKMLAFRQKLRKLNIKFNRPFLSIVFGKKGETNFTVRTKKETYAVSVISYVSTHGRWNIEKGRNHYYAECRRYNNVFYNVYNNTGTEPEHSKEYRRESRIRRERLYLPESDGTDKQILLFYPTPKELTYTETRLEYLGKGSKINGYRVMFEDEFFALLNSK